MKNVFKILSLIMIIIFCLSFVGCKKKENSSKIINNPSSIDTLINEDGDEVVNIIKAMNNKLHESEKYGKEYSITIPDWEQLEDYNYTETKTNTDVIKRKNVPDETITTSQTYDFYTRAFKSQKENVYLLVTEYFGSDLYGEGAEQTYGETHKAIAKGVSTLVGEKCLQKYINPELYFETYSFEPYNEKIHDCYWYCNKTNDNNPIYSKGYILTDLEKPFLITVIDASDSRGYDEQVEKIMKQIILSFSDSH